VRNSVEIEAPTAAVWQVLTDFPRYPDWNDFIQRVEGRPVRGSRLKMAMALPGRGLRTLKSRVLEAKPQQELCWRSRTGLPGILDRQHRFALEELPGHRCRLTQSESFTGLFRALVSQDLLDRIDRGFTAMNFALKIRAENL
jgi:hypothetical protein